MEDADLITTLAPAGPARPAREVVAEMELGDDLPAGRPRVVAVMIAAPDGRAAVAGRSGGLGRPADRDVLREARVYADALLVGTGTLRAERYGHVLDDEQRERRRAAGRDPEPRVVTISRDLRRLPVGEARIFAEPQARVSAYTATPATEAPDPAVAADLEVVRAGATGCAPAAVLADLHARHGVRVVVTEGGPMLLRALLADGVVDDLLLTVAPLLVGGDGPSLLAGEPLGAGVPLHLASVHRAGNHLFLHHRVRA